MYDINITKIAGMTPDSMFSSLHSSIAVPSLIILFGAIFLIFLIVALIFKSPHTSLSKFLQIWGTSAVIGFLVLLVFILLPNVVNKFINGVANVFN